MQLYFRSILILALSACILTAANADDPSSTDGDVQRDAAPRSVNSVQLEANRYSILPFKETLVRHDSKTGDSWILMDIDSDSVAWVPLQTVKRGISAAVMSAQAATSNGVDYVWPNEATLFEFRRPTDLAQFRGVGSDTLTANFHTQHPPKGLEHWQLELQKIQPGMTEFALMHRIPPAALTQRANVQGLGVHSELLMCYAVDSKHGIVVQMSCHESTTLKGQTFALGRVERVIGIFEHGGVLTDFNTLPISFCNNLTLADLVAP